MQNAKELTKLLISIESSNPGTYENTLADYLEAQLKAVLPVFGKIIRKEYEDKSSVNINEKRRRPVMMAELSGYDPRNELVFICHMDTVPIGENWTVNPLCQDKSHDTFNLDEKLHFWNEDIYQNRIYGRGSCDMKSGLACALSAFGEACNEAKKRGPFQNTLKLILTSDEEGDMQGVEQVIDLGWVTKESFVMDTEPTNREIQTAHKGRFWYEFICTGKVAHASKPKEGANAILGMSYAITIANELFRELENDAFCGESCLTFGKISGGTQAYQVPGKCCVSVDMRLVPPYDVRVGEEILNRAAKLAKEKIQGVDFSVKITGNRPAIAHNEKSVLLKWMLKTIEDVTGKRPKVDVFPGYTDTAVIAAKTGCREILSYGPGNLAQAHQPDEFVEISDIERCEKIYIELLKKFLNNSCSI